MVMRRFGHDPMRRRLEPGAATYRVPKPVRPVGHMTASSEKSVKEGEPEMGEFVLELWHS